MGMPGVSLGIPGSKGIGVLLDEQIKSNRRKSRLLFLGFLFIYALLALATSYLLGGWPIGNSYFVLIGFAAVVGVIIAFAWWGGDDMAVLVGGGKQIHRREQCPPLWDAVETMSIAAGVPMPRVYISPDPSPNAFAAGSTPEKSIVCVNQGLLEILDKDELEGVIAHEISHIRNFDVRTMTFAAVLAGGIVILVEVLARVLLFGGNNNNNNGPMAIVGLVATILAVLLAPLMALIIQMSISRRREFLADASAADLTRYPQGLASALAKITSSNVSPRYHEKAIAHLYISAPAAGKRKRSMFSTHPDPQERIDRLTALASGQTHQARPGLAMDGQSDQPAS